MGMISSIRRTVTRVGGCGAGRSRTVVAGSCARTRGFLSRMSTTTICIGTSAEFASKGRFKFNTRVKVDARGLRTENPVKLLTLAAAGCVVCNGKRMHPWSEWDGTSSLIHFAFLGYYTVLFYG